MNSYEPIPDQTLRDLVKRAIIRSSEIDWSLFIAIRCGGSENVECFAAALPAKLSEFLCGCASFAFPRGPMPASSPPTKPQYTGIADVELRSVMEKAVARATDLGLLCFFDLEIPARHPSRQFETCYVGDLPLEIASHLARCFDVAIAASRKPGLVDLVGEGFKTAN